MVVLQTFTLQILALTLSFAQTGRQKKRALKEEQRSYCGDGQLGDAQHWSGFPLIGSEGVFQDVGVQGHRWVGHGGPQANPQQQRWAHPSPVLLWVAHPPQSRKTGGVWGPHLKVTGRGG